MKYANEVYWDKMSDQTLGILPSMNTGNAIIDSYKIFPVSDQTLGMVRNCWQFTKKFNELCKRGVPVQNVWSDTRNISQVSQYKYSVLPIYRGRVYCGIGYIPAACWTPFFGAQERDIFREITVTPWTQFAGDNFSRNSFTGVAFVLGPQETIFRETNSSLLVNAGWNTCCAVVSHARRSTDTSIVSQSRVQLIQCQCKSRLQIANLGINNEFLIKSSLFAHAVYIHHFVQTLGQFHSESRARDW